MRTSYERVLSRFLASLTVVSLVSPAVTSASSQDKTNAAAAPSEVVSSETNAYPLSRPSQSTPQPGPAWKTIGGTVKQIQGDIYVVEDYEGNQIQLYVSRDTKRLRGQKKVGDRVRAEITRDGFANSIQ